MLKEFILAVLCLFLLLFMIVGFASIYLIIEIIQENKEGKEDSND